MEKIDPTIFKAYDIRGVYPSQINEEAVYKIAQAYAKFVNPKTVVLSRDVRLSGPALFEAVKNGLVDHGVNVIDIGIGTTDMFYFAVANYGYDGGMMISASHNPGEYNGLKIVREKSIPTSGDTGIEELKRLVLADYKFKAETSGNLQTKDVAVDYLAKCASFIDSKKLKVLKVVVNGMFGPAVQNVFKLNLPVELVPLNEVPDGHFPKGAPDPLLEQNRTETTELVKSSKADMGAAWDADADRFFLFDENGRFIPGYYLTAFLGRYFAQKIPGAKIIFDPRATWATIDSVTKAGGVPLMNKAGHSFIKERMRKEDAVFGGEMSGHFYFKDFFYCDNGLIPFLLILEIVSGSGKKVSELFEPFFEQYFVSGEINTSLQSDSQIAETFERIEKEFKDSAIDRTDGLSLEYSDWRANIRSSNTQSLIRLNVEARDPETLKVATQSLLELIQN
ncbi:MAG: phosphomannomutase/phosphoglucomutase [Candidatus Doudnabacteria bacterium]